MGDLGQRIEALTVETGTVAIAWLGQAGFVIKTPDDVIAMIDPYLSDFAELIWGVKRAYPPVLEPHELTPHLLLATHWHEDHLDRETVIAYRDAQVILVGPESCLARARGWGWPTERQVPLERDEQVKYGDFDVTATFARHEQPLAPVPDAVGFLIDVDGFKIWNVGDSEYDARLRPFRDERIDVMLVPINGVGGNMNVHEAAFLTWWVEPRFAVPTHYDMWTPEGFGPDATLNPADFVEGLENADASVNTRIMEPGEIAIFRSTLVPK